MHDKALDLLRQYVLSFSHFSCANYPSRRLSEKEDDMEDKLQPSISYLQKLGPEHLDQIFKSSHWMFEQDRDMAFHVCALRLLRCPNADPILDIHLGRCGAPSSRCRRLFGRH
jgi:hypothetical protein